MLDDLGLIAALESLVQTFGARPRVIAELQHENMDLRLVPELETAIYRIVQEGLSNVAKHAAAERCTVSLTRDSNFVRLVIQDDGIGFAAEPGADVTRHGLGLIGIRERAALLGGFLRVVTAAGRGTRLFVEFPLARESRDLDHDTSSDFSR
jgi:signal transduction histidine kinase